MAIGDALSKHTTYGEIEDNIRIHTGTIDDPRIPPALMIKEISLSVQRVAGILNGATAPFYVTTNTALAISGAANPYSVNLSSLSPFIDKIKRFVHVTTGGTRTFVDLVDQEEAENRLALTNVYGSSIWGVWEGDAVRLYSGASFTITTGTDTTELKYYRIPKVGTVSGGTVVSDTAWSASGTTISAFTGTLASHVGALFAGLDNSANPFVRTITGYVSTTSFTIDSALVAGGAGTNGYIIPLNVLTAPTRSTYVDVPDKYVPLLIVDMKNKILSYKNNAPNPGLQGIFDNEVAQIYREFQTSMAVENSEGKR